MLFLERLTQSGLLTHRRSLLSKDKGILLPRPDRSWQLRSSTGRMGRALDTVSRRDALGWFEHCCYDALPIAFVMETALAC
ncbi:MAG: hypothetical protein JOZ19_08990 [Rubrobacter sp.]|nr:hypothetical protein [Rubrobacter sp.]